MATARCWPLHWSMITSQAKPKCQLGAETCAKRKLTSPCLLAIPVFDRIAGLYNRHLNSNRGICLHYDYWTARLSLAQGPCSTVLPTVHGCHYAFQKFPFFCVTLYITNILVATLYNITWIFVHPQYYIRILLKSLCLNVTSMVPCILP
jgi:hypothetical protein